MIPSDAPIPTDNNTANKPSETLTGKAGSSRSSTLRPSTLTDGPSVPSRISRPMYTKKKSVALFGTPYLARSAASTVGVATRSFANGLPGAAYISSVVAKINITIAGTRNTTRRCASAGRYRNAASASPPAITPAESGASTIRKPTNAAANTHSADTQRVGRAGRNTLPTNKESPNISATTSLGPMRLAVFHPHRAQRVAVAEVRALVPVRVVELLVEAVDSRLDQPVVHVEVERDDRHVVVDQQRFGLAEQRHAQPACRLEVGRWLLLADRRVDQRLDLVAFAEFGQHVPGCPQETLHVTGSADQLVVHAVAPTGLVVAAVGHVQLEERVRILVVAAPGRARNVVVEELRRGLIRLPLLVVAVGFDAEAPLPLVGDHLRDLLVRLHGVEQDPELREALPAWKSGFGEQRARRGEIVAQRGHRRVVAGDPRRDEPERRLLPDPEHVARDDLAIDGHAQRLAHARVTERLSRGVHAVIVDRERGALVKVGPLLELVDQVGGEGVGRHPIGLDRKSTRLNSSHSQISY